MTPRNARAERAQLLAILTEHPQTLGALRTRFPHWERHILWGRLYRMERAGLLARRYPKGQCTEWYGVPGAVRRLGQAG